MPDYLGEERRAPQPLPELGWHLKKEVNLSIIISVLGIAVAVITGYTDLKKDIALINADISVLHRMDASQSEEAAAAITSVQRQLDKLDGKLDRLIERGRL